MDRYTISLRGIRFVARLGASKEERAREQEILVDVDLELPTSALPKSDRRKDVVDYDAIVRRVVDEGLATQFHLLETYATRVVNRLVEETPAIRVRISVTKTRAPTSYPIEGASVELVRSK